MRTENIRQTTGLTLSAFGLCVIAVTAGSACAAEAGKASSGGKAVAREVQVRLADLEQRVLNLEKSLVDKDARLAELSNELEAMKKKQGGGETLRRPDASLRELGKFRGRMDRFNRDFNEMYRKIFPKDDDQGAGFGGGNFPFFRQTPTHKPRLGVLLSAPTDELRERWKNNVDAGSFITDVVPDSPADKAGLKAGDCVTTFDDRKISSPGDLVAAVREAKAGAHKLTVVRAGAALAINVTLGEKPGGGELAVRPGRPSSGWWRSSAGGVLKPGKQTERRRSSVQASALELTNELSESLKLDEKTRRKMDKVLSRCRQDLGEAVAKEKTTDFRRVRELVAEQIKAAEKKLRKVLNAEQMKRWREYRRTHNSLTFSMEQKTTVIGSGGGVGGEREKKTKESF